jgi:dolichol kinase
MEPSQKLDPLADDDEKILKGFDRLEARLKQCYDTAKKRAESGPEIAQIKSRIMSEKKILLAALDKAVKIAPADVGQDVEKLKSKLRRLMRHLRQSVLSQEKIAEFSRRLARIRLATVKLMEQKVHQLEALPYTDRLIDDQLVIATKSHLQIARKCWHASGGSLIAFVYLLVDIPKFYFLIILGTITAFVTFFDFYRLRHPHFNRRVVKDFALFIRDVDVNSLSTMTYFLVSSWLTIFLFPRQVAILAILFLTFGDPIASFVGIKFGKTRLHWGKSIEGSLACYATCFLISMIYLGSAATQRPLSVFIFSVYAGALGAIVEVLPWKLDDNLTIPLLAGFLMTPMYTLLFQML